MIANPSLTAYHLYAGEPTMKLLPAPQLRAWIDETPQKFARRCLPLLIGSASGWLALNPHTFHVTWNGGIERTALRIDYEGRDGIGLVSSHFGSGILTWNLPYLFRTSPGYNLLFRGPANHFKDGASPLEGVVEADWAVATTTMNWKLTRPGLTVTFEQEEPVCMLVPQKHGEMESFTSSIQHITDNPELMAAYSIWAESRATFLHDLSVPESEACKRGWQKDYFQGVGNHGTHQTKLALRPFEMRGDVCR